MPEGNVEVVVALIGLAGTIAAEMIRRHRAQNATDRRLDAVLHEMQPNSGKSMHDKVTRIENSVDDLREKYAEHGERLAAVEARARK